MFEEVGCDNGIVRVSSSDRLFLSLVKHSFGKESNDALAFSGNVWATVVAMSKQQGVSALIVDGLQNYLSANPDMNPFADESATDKLKRLQWFGQVMAYERFYSRHEKAIADLARLYAGKGIRIMVLKGYGLSLDWPVPNHRAVGDLDVYVFGRWKDADALVERECGIKVEAGHEHHTVFAFEGVPVENHYDFINTRAHRDAPGIETRLKALAEKEDCKEIEVRGERVFLPSADFNAIFLMRHMGQHFAGEHLNLRQVLDWGFFVRAHHEEVDWVETVRFLKEIGLYVFFCQINAVCVDFLGFEEGVFPTIERDSVLEQRIFADILHPEFAEEKPSSGLLRVLVFKLRRWWHNRWKHPLVYKEWLLPMFLTLLWSHLRRVRTIGD